MSSGMGIKVSKMFSISFAVGAVAAVFLSRTIRFADSHLFCAGDVPGVPDYATGDLQDP